MNWRKAMLVAAFAGLSSLAGGCAFVSSSTPGLTTATGESWYTKDKWFLFFPLGTDIYYCPGGDQKCYRAQIR